MPVRDSTHHTKAHHVREAHRAHPLAALPEVWASHPAVHRGAPVFAGTAVLVETLLEYREAGSPLYEFLIDFPTVRHLHARRLWAWMGGHTAAQIRGALRTTKTGQVDTRHEAKGHEVKLE